MEMQTTSDRSLADRIVAYACRLYSEQIRRGGKYDELVPVYSLVFSTVDLPMFREVPRHVHVCDVRMRGGPGDPEVVLTDLLGFVVVELGRKFRAEARDLPGLGPRDAWRWLLKNSAKMGRKEYEGFINKGGDMAEAVRPLWRMSSSDVQRAVIEAEEKREAVRRSELKTARMEGIEEVARNLLGMGTAREDVLKATGLTESELAELEDS